MKNVLVILPKSIGGRLTVSSIKDGFKLNGFNTIIFDELKDDKENFLNSEYEFIIGYDFSPVKFKIDNFRTEKTIAYFSDVIYSPASESYYKEYYKYLKNPDIFTFYWDRELTKKEKNPQIKYMPHFVNCEIYKDFKPATSDVSFMGRFDTDLRLNIWLELNKKLPEYKFKWYAIKRHYDDALSRCKTEEEKNIIEKTYSGFIDNEIDMAQKINDTKIVYNVNAQGLSSLNYRTFQVLACKRLIISDFRGELDLFNNILPIYKDVDDLAEKIKYYLNNKNEYDSIVLKCQKIILKNHNSKDSAYRMINAVNM